MDFGVNRSVENPQLLERLGQPIATIKYGEIALIVVWIPDYEKTDFHFRTTDYRYDSKLLCVWAARHHDYDHDSAASNNPAGDESTCNEARWYVGELALPSPQRPPWLIFSFSCKANDGGKIMVHLIWYIVVGLIAGVIAKSVMHVHMTIFWTIVLGIIGSILGGAVTHLFSPPTTGRFHPAGIIFSTLGAILILYICLKLHIRFPRVL
jgi:uncharacterized membrane protein YeaQ/YmgE (transglycosylase-associated protein family)